MPVKRQAFITSFFKPSKSQQPSPKSTKITIRDIANGSGGRGEKECDKERSPTAARTPSPKTTQSSKGAAKNGATALQSGMSPEVKALIAEKRVNALRKKLSKTPLAQLPGSWGSLLGSELLKPYFHKLVQFLHTEYNAKKIFPPCGEVYEALRKCDAAKVKVVIIGQDPYHDHNQAHGMCFSVRHGIKTPRSLVNIYKELTSDLGRDNFKWPKHGCLERWADQGVLLLNTVLTVQAHKANSHRGKGWEMFTDALIAQLNVQGGAEGKPIVFLCWGRPAQTKAARINKLKHTVIACSHPSPLGATKTKAPFIGSRCFSRANKALVSSGHEPVDWQV